MLPQDERTDRRKELVLRLLGVVGFVVALLFLPVLSRQCGLSAPTPPLPGPGITADPPSPTPLPTETSFPSPLPTATSFPSPLPTPTAVPLVSPLTTQTRPLPATVSVPVYTYRVVQTYPHDAEAWTQGLVYHEGFLYEGTGLRGHSFLRRVDLETGEVKQSLPLEDSFFGEGIVIWEDRLYQLTWQSRTGFIYDWQTFQPLGSWTYDTEGWGLTHDGTHLIMSDGTPVLRFLDPETLAVMRQVEVRAQSGPVVWLNELEYVNGEIYANVWPTDRIVRIAPETGKVAGWIDMKGLLTPNERGEEVDVFNGIAYDSDNDRLFVTGKYWPKLFEIRLIPAR